MKFCKFLFLVMYMALAFTLPVYASSYDVSVPHVIINQVFGGDGGYVSHNFIELYNPTNSNVDLSGWAIHYRSSPADENYSDKWYKTELTGEIPSRCSYLILYWEDESYDEKNYPGRKLTDYDILLTGGGVFLTKASL